MSVIVSRLGVLSQALAASSGSCQANSQYQILKKKAEPGPRTNGGRLQLEAPEIMAAFFESGRFELSEEVLSCVQLENEIRFAPGVIDKLLRQPWAKGRKRELLEEMKAGWWGSGKPRPAAPPPPPPPKEAPPPPAEAAGWGLRAPTLTAARATLNYDLNLGQSSYDLDPSETGLRNFRKDSGFPTIGLALAAIEWGPHPDLFVHTDVIAGRDEPIMNPEGLGVHTDRVGGFGVGLWQLYAQWGPSDRSHLKVGRWATVVGAEGVGPDNPNISRSFLFEYAEPLSHVGVAGTFQDPEGRGGITGGVCNGWNHLIPPRPLQTGFVRFFANPSDRLALSLTSMIGLEEVEGGPVSRGLLDAVADWRSGDNDRLLFNADFGGDAGLLAGAAPDGSLKIQGNPPTGNWYGASLVYERRRGPYRVAGRVEGFHDDGTRTDIEDVWYGEGTVTAGRELGDQIFVRAEYRHDLADREVFPRDGGGRARHQDMVSLELVARF